MIYRFYFILLNILFSVAKLQGQNYFFERVYDETLAQASYIIADPMTKDAIVIDPKRDIDTYVNIAKEKGLTIKKVSETHIHADFLSGSRELAAAAKAELLLSDEGGEEWQYEFPHTGLKDGNIIKIGRIQLKVMHTPGHTPESITFLVNNFDNKDVPIKAITGDFIFVGDVGRPDLLEKSAGQAGTQEASAKQLYTSLQKFSKLNDNVEIWPGHGAGSFCGKSLSSVPQSTLKDEKFSNKAFQFGNDENGFVKYILEGQPTPPRYFTVMKRLNRVERPLLINIPDISNLNNKSFSKAVDNNAIIIDTRKKEIVAQGSITGSIHIEDGSSFSTWVGSLINYDKPIILIAEEDQRENLTRKLMRIGMDNIYGFVTDVSKMNVNLEKSNLVSREELKKKMVNGNTQVIDVRTENEYSNGHINGAENIVLTSLENNLNKISDNKEVIIHCQSGVRASMAYSLLKRNGIKNVQLYLGGINEWKDKGEPLVSH